MSISVASYELEFRGSASAFGEGSEGFRHEKDGVLRYYYKICLFLLGFQASRKTPEGAVGIATEENKGAMVIINCESEPVSKTPEFNKLVATVSSTLLAQDAGDYTGEAIIELNGVKDALAQAIGLLKENIQIKDGTV